MLIKFFLFLPFFVLLLLSIKIKRAMRQDGPSRSGIGVVIGIGGALVVYYGTFGFIIKVLNL